MEEKTVSEIIDEVKQQMCDGYCCKPAEVSAQYDGNPRAAEEALETICLCCPLSRL